MTDTRTIQRAAEETGLTADTLRYYERIGILPGIGRSQSGHRRFTDDDMGWIKLVQCLRATGMPLEDLHRYAELVQEGEHTAAERLRLLEAHQLPHPGRAGGPHGRARPGRHEDRRLHEARREGLRPRAARPPARAAPGAPEDRTPALRRRCAAPLARSVEIRYSLFNFVLDGRAGQRPRSFDRPIPIPTPAP